MKIYRAIVIANRTKMAALQAKREVERFLISQGIKLSSKKPQLVVTVGGDGTVLLPKKYYGIPFFSIGSRTSFICQAGFSDWRQKLARSLRNFRTEKRLLLQASIDGKKLPPSLNEVGIRNPEPRVLSLCLSSGKRRAAFRADGVIFSTPTGSPAYCYSCGGREMKRAGMRYQVVAIAPFRRLFAPTIFPSSVPSVLRLVGGEIAEVFVDGQAAGKLSEKNSLEVCASKKSFLFLK